MPRKVTQARIEWLPGPAAQEALQTLRALRPGYSQQDLIDLALIQMAWSDRFQMPQMPGRDRKRWVLPAALRLPHVNAVPELSPRASQSRASQSSGTPCSRYAGAFNIRSTSED